MAHLVSQSRRREKPILSCTYCRGRKLRCDRQSPCEACIRHGTPSECFYTSSEQERKDAVDYRPRVRNQIARQRVRRLENLVNEMRDMVQRSQNPAAVPSPDGVASTDFLSLDELPKEALEISMGKLSVTESSTVFTGNSHWTTILEDIRGLKDDLAADESDIDCAELPSFLGTKASYIPVGARISLLMSLPSISRDEIITVIPERKIVDRHVSQFFNAYDWAPFILNRNLFLKDYSRFWSDPSATPIMWIGILSGMICMSTLLQQRNAEAHGMPAAKDDLEVFRVATIHCLNAGKYLEPNNHTIEALILYFATEQALHVDPDTANWVLIGIIIRIAMRTGLHRDPSHWPSIRPLHAELRRRMWMTLFQMDFFTSTQLGLPRIIKDSQCDTRSPLHLLDRDINFETEHAPPERPQTEPSPLSYIIQRHIIVKVTAEIYDASEAPQISSDTIDLLNAKLQRAVARMPPWLRYTSLESTITDDPDIILQRMFIDILIHKAVYLLHRRSFIRNTNSEDKSRSNELCIEAALAILQHQLKMNEETRPGGFMFNIRWKVANSLNHEFLQATMMLCLVLSRLKNLEVTPTTLVEFSRQNDIVEALMTAKVLWEQIANRSSEARRAAKAISKVLEQASTISTPAPSMTPHGAFEPISHMDMNMYPDWLDFGADVTGELSFMGDRSENTILNSMSDDLALMSAFGTEHDSDFTYLAP